MRVRIMYASMYERTYVQMYVCTDVSVQMYVCSMYACL